MRVAGVALLLAAGAAWLGATQGWRPAALWLVGAGLGLSLYHAGFGFAGAFRALLAERRTAGVRAQFLLLGLGVLLVHPALAAGEVLGQPVRGFVFPPGAAMLAGAFLFGIGMQWGGGCASGTLYAAGGASGRSLLTLLFFILGATLAAWQAPLWQGWPGLPPVSLPRLLGTGPAMALALGVLGAAWVAAARLERARHGAAAPIHGPARLLRGPWSLAHGAVALALLGFATLVLAGRPWAITAAFPLWGSLVVEAAGWDDPAFWEYWEDPTRAEALLRQLAGDRTTLMDLGLIAGAALAAALAGRWRLAWRVPARQVAGAVLGGLLLGIGAVMATGCNISAYVAGIASGSLHGWLWIIPGLAGNWVGMRLRPWFAGGGKPE